ncbi:glycosyltransferase [Gracilibacillus boraciitolerans JCM 21714]|uniref:Glycosyltransferase n=1 Tax=Gracilibacillus boraciitolerans JCM 21714 TaxID=1298598 RepID=W4VPT0_9BACI|nr:ATP-grasp fold amidoligase family protein [Gracilibacillus boraciitolerans]GAE95212.1 glycosyltransferase [Gracilibacillus boraciitolerans JCM 21714]
MGEFPNLKNPKSFNEKLQFLKLYHRDPLMTQCADKYEVRKYISEKIGDHVLNELYGVYDSVEEIDFGSLPKEFVMKVTHGSGQNLICKDKSEIDWNKEKENLKKYMKKNHYYFNGEWPYKDIKPRIIVEKFLTDKGTVPMDYKLFCINGYVEFIVVDEDRFGEHKQTLYDKGWNKLGVKMTYENSKNNIEKPKSFDDMLDVAEKLSKPFPFARIDFYEVKEKLVFGEITFYPKSGCINFSPSTFNNELGERFNVNYN